MANGYLGKISAIVTANTSDFSSKLNASAKDVRKFAAELQGSLSSAESKASASLRGIYTEAQKLDRALKAISTQKLAFKGFEGSTLDRDVKRVQQLASATLSITKPLADGTRAFGQLSAGVQAEFLPALISAQKGTEALTATINKFGDVSSQRFAAVESDVTRTVQAIARLREAEQSVGGLATGRELRFQQPAFAQQVNRSAQLQGAAATLTPDQIQGGAIAQLIAQQRQAAEEASRLLSALERVRLSRNGDAAAAEAAYRSQVESLRIVNNQLEREISLAGEAAAATRARAQAASQLLNVLQQESTLISNEGAASTTDPTGRSIAQRIQDIANLRRVEEERANAALRQAEADEVAASAARLRAQAAGQLLNVLQQESTLISNEGAASTTDPTGRSIAQRIQDIANLRRVEEERANAALRQAEADEVAASAARLRAQAAGQLLNVLQQESTLISNEGARSETDATGRSIAQRIRDIANLRAAEQAQAAAEADQQRRRDVASTFLPVLQQESADLSTRGAFGGPQAPPLPPGFGGDSAAGIGAPIADASRQLDRLRGSLSSVKGQVDSLPAGLRAQFIPAIAEAEQRFLRLAANGVGATAEQIENAAAEVDRLRQRLGAAAQAAQLPTFAQFAADLDARQAIGQVQGLQQVLIRVGAQAGGPVATAFDRYTAAVQEAVAAGTTGLPRVQRELDEIQREAIDAAVATGRITRGTANRLVRRGGDIASGAAGNAGLAVQQAVFAFEDFFSVTGGLDQRIRAAGNNLSQLGVILGGTTGLVIGVSAAITGQLIAALIKWYSAGVDVQDNVKALNDSLARQRSLAEDLANAFNNVADAIASTGFSKQNQELRERQKLLDEISNKQNEQQRERIAGLDPTVQRERAVQAARQRELDAASDPGERIRLTREIRASQQREREAADRALANPGIDAQQAVQAVGSARFGVRQAEINQAARAAAANSPSAAAQQRIEQQRLADIERARQETADFEARQGARIAGIRDPREQVRAASELIDQEQQRIQSSITTGIAGFFDQGANQERRRRLVELEQARANLEKDIFRAAANRTAIEATKIALEAAAGIGAAQEILAQAIGDGASQTRRELDNLSQSLIDAENRLKSAQESGNVVGAEAAKAEIESINRSRQAYESAARSVAAFASVLDRISGSLANTVASEARGRADQSRRDANRTRATADAGLGGLNPRREAEFRDRQRQRAEEDARAAEDRRDRINRQNDLRRRLFEQDAASGALGQDVQGLIRQRDEAQRIIDSRTASEDDRANAIIRRDRANRALDRAFEDSPAGRAAAEAADRADQADQARRETEASIERGRALRQTPAQRAANEVATGIQDIANSINEEIDGVIDAANGLPGARDRAQIEGLQQQGAEALSRFVNEQARAAAPAIFSLADSVANALLQGPSRAALQATDVSTVEGQRELNRLLRGDDSARDQNIVELEKQSQLLEGIKDAATKTAERMGIVLDWK